jgi:hypothetical protein
VRVSDASHQLESIITLVRRDRRRLCQNIMATTETGSSGSDVLSMLHNESSTSGADGRDSEIFFSRKYSHTSLLLFSDVSNVGI